MSVQSQPLITRRAILKGAAGFHLGLLLRAGAEPLLLLARDLDPASEDPSQTPSMRMGAWLSVTPDGQVTLRVHKSEMGQGVRTGLAMILAEELDADWARVRVEQAPTDPDTYGSHSTAGSGSTSGNYQNLRRIGAGARLMFIQAAAARWGVSAESCVTEPGKVVHSASRRELGYGALADEAGRLTPPDAASLRLKAPAEFRIIGKGVNRVDSPDIVRGRARYTADVRLPGMAFAVVARCPVIGGRPGRYDEAAALAVPGVIRVLPVNRGVAVVAENTWAAMQGRDKLAVEWNLGANTGISDDSIRAGLRQASQSAPELPAGRAVSAEYDLPFLPHAAMEPLCCVAAVRADGADVWAPSQNPGDLKRTVATVLNLPQSAITVHLPLLGGSFGRNASSTVTEAVGLSRNMGRPVLLTWSREDDLRQDNYRPASHHRLRAALDAGGRPVAWQHRGAMAGGGAGERELTPPYDLQGLDLSMATASLAVPVGAWRSVIHSAVVFVNESFMDELAAAAGQDPLAYRRRFLTNRRVLGVLDRAAAEIGWSDTLPAGAGRGIACAACFGSYVATAVELTVEGGSQVRLRRVVVAVDCGLPVNPRGVESQIQGAAIDGLSTAFRAAVSLKGGGVQQSSFHDFEWFRLGDAPPIEVHLVTGNSSSPGGVGEVGYPTVAPAVANAIFAATGRRLRRLPMTELTVIGAAPVAAPTLVPATATSVPPEPTATAAAASPTPAVEPTATGQPAAEQDKLFMPRLGGS
ncbi:MAG: xanthine dehydrogenase family protein molybdopterin-binding subunit [Ardenticatenia bacterium]|nr:xanthine dehydrogenase family protein molybdopterin-binding subunit [Ardenticatenia bacterium]